MVTTAMFTAALIGSVAGGSPTPVHADAGIAVSSITTYTIDEAAAAVHVTMEMTMVNTLPDRRSGKVIEQSYFSGYTVDVPASAEKPAAMASDGTPMKVSRRVEAQSDQYGAVDITFPDRLFYQQSLRFTLSYYIGGMPPRSDNSTRVNPAYISFLAFGVGDPSKVDVVVKAPDAYSVELLGGDTTSTDDGATTTYTAAGITSPSRFTLFVSARNDSLLDSVDHRDKANRLFTVSAWPGDSGWKSFVTEQIDTGIPQLEQLIGQPWPVDNLEIHEAYTPYLHGYDGWFSASQRTIELGELLDAETTLHELSHAWFNENHFAGRWMNEGFAQVYSNKVLAATNQEASTADTPDTAAEGHIALNAWGSPKLDSSADATEDYGYNASFWLATQFADEVGDDKMRAVLGAIIDRRASYQGPGDPITFSGAVDWQRLLDLLDDVGGSTRADDLIIQYVASKPEVEQLRERSTTRAAYAQLTSAGSGWVAPRTVRAAMAVWDFKVATRAIADAQVVLDARAHLDTQVAQLHTSYPTSFKTSYEVAMNDDLNRLATTMSNQSAVADQLISAEANARAEHGLFGRIGLVGTNLGAQLDEAKAAFAAGDLDAAVAEVNRVDASIDGAASLGQRRFGITVLIAVLLVELQLTMLVWMHSRLHRPRVATASSGRPPLPPLPPLPLVGTTTVSAPWAAPSGPVSTAHPPPPAR